MKGIQRVRRGPAFLTGGVIAMLGVTAWAATTASAPTPTPAQNPWAVYVTGGKWVEGQEYFRNAITESLEGGKRPPAEELLRLHAGWLACAYFPAMERAPLSAEERKGLAAWLLEHAAVFRAVMPQVDSSDDVPRVFEILHVLRRSAGKAVLRFPNLAAAYALTWDTEAPDNEFLRKAFDFHTGHAEAMRTDLREMPVEILKYLVDSRRPVAEREWALKRFGSISEMNRIYEMPEYDWEHVLTGKEKRVSKHEDTLENILKYGGVCHERAIFASEVGKATGIPCVYVSGEGVSGAGHAWIAYLRRRGKEYIWDHSAGSTGEDDTAFGRIRDPQDGATVSEYTLELGLSALTLSAERRCLASAWRDAAVMLAKAGKGSLAVDALTQSVAIGVFDRRQWNAAADLAQRKATSSEAMERLTDRIVSALDENPMLALDAFEAVFAAAPPDDLRSARSRLERMRKRWPKHDAAVGRLWLIEGRLIEARGNASEARRVYSEAVLPAMKCKVVALALLDNAGRLMVKQKDVRAALELHERAFFKTPELPRNIAVQYTTRFEVGVRRAALMLLAGDKKGHDQLLTSLCSAVRGGGAAQQELLKRVERWTYSDINTTTAPGAD